MGIGRKSSELGNQNSIMGQLMGQAMTVVTDPFNKVNNGKGFDSSNDPKSQDALTLEMDDKELSDLSKKWEADYAKYEQPIKAKQENNHKYWKGEQFGYKAEGANAIDNVIFSNLETLLPLVSRQTPSPLVYSRGGESDQSFALGTAKILEDVADAEKLKVKIKQMTRHWALFYLGAIKIGWKAETDNIEFTVLRPQDLILDPCGTFDGAEFKGRYAGIRKQEEASMLVKRFPEKEAAITEKVHGKMGTKVDYIEWWTQEFVFWTMGTTVLDKSKNPNFNYEEQKPQMDAMGMQTMVPQTKKNHFPAPKIPISFLWVFNLGSQPHDETCLVEQAIPLQDGVNKRTRQIDKNADDTNNGWVFNDQFSTDDAASALRALRGGGAIVAPTTNISDSVMRMTAPNLAAYVINDLFDKRNQIADIMGTRGSSASGVQGEDTVRGKIQISQKDVDRLSLIVEQVEQAVDYLFNYATQMIFTYYDMNNCVSEFGSPKGDQYFLQLEAPVRASLTVSVKEGSMIPQDPLLRRNEAVELFTAGAMDPLTLYERMDMPDPQESTNRLMAYKMGQMPGAGGGVPPEGVAPPPPTAAPQDQGLPPVAPPAPEASIALPPL